MGRHSASYIAARQGLSSGPTAAGAAKYVGRVGSLALALGIGAAVAGGTGLAHADGDADSGAGSNPNQSQADPSTGQTAAKEAKEPSAVESPTVGSPGAKTTEPATPTVPKMRLGDGRGQDTLGGLIAGIPQRIAAALAPHAPAAASTPSTTSAATPRSSRGSAQPSTDPAPTDPTATDDAPVDPFVRRVANAADAAIRGEVRPLRATPSLAASTTQKLDPSPAVTLAAPTSAANSAAAVQVAPTTARPVPANPIATVISSVLSALGLAPSASSTGDSPAAPMPLLMGVLQLVRRELELISLTLNPPAPLAVLANPNPAAVETGVPTPGEEMTTAYGDIGKWMLESNGQISDYGGHPYDGKTLLEPVNVIIVDPTSSSPEEATRRLNAAMFWSGFPAQPIHTTGFEGTIDDVTYGQLPKGLISGYSDNLFIFPNDHGRIFGPDPANTGEGYVWSGAFSTEQLTIFDFLPAHEYVSSNMARNALATRLILSGEATYGGLVALDNSYDTATTTTGDHDGYAVVLVLR